MMTKKQFKECLEKAGSIAISGHVRPDGDCTGSTLALAQYIRDNWKEKKVQELKRRKNKSFESGRDE